MLQHQYMAPWVPTFESFVHAELAANNNNPPFTSFQLATSDADGHPHVRTVIYRGFLFGERSSNIITLNTDRRMGKYEELCENDRVEAVFYFPMTRKQFRLQGYGRIIDSSHYPNVDVSNERALSVPEEGENSNSDTGSALELFTSLKNAPPSGTATGVCQARKLRYGLMSPTLLKNLKGQRPPDASSINLHEIPSEIIAPPTTEEWDAEVQRQWENLSKTLKKSFRKPCPNMPLSDDAQRQIDSIHRSVDGKKDDDGFRNFAVVGLFVDYVDIYELDKDRRYIYKKDAYHMWSEEEVCP